ncbi:MAG: adenylate/guanylate cyclase domain-containing protein [Candidatus Bathyarchaeia archaeon]
MPNRLRELLENAVGVSDNIVAIFIDIRSFSAFSKTHDSAEVATFVRHAYVKIIDEYFPNATFYKPTGDGLLIVLTYHPIDVIEVVVSAITTCQRLVEEFKGFCVGEPMVPFKGLPDRVGIGIARGAACRLESEGQIVDYSGNILNLAARLMDIARPTGVVLDSSVIANIDSNKLPDFYEESFVQATGYLRGVAETEPVTVCYNKKDTILSESFKLPLNSSMFTETTELTLNQLRRLSKNGINYARTNLKSTPIYPRQIEASVKWTGKGGLAKGKIFYEISNLVSYEYGNFGTFTKPTPIVSFNVSKLLDLLSTRSDVTGSKKLTIFITYLRTST